MLAILMQAKEEGLLEVASKYTGEFIQKIDKKQELEIIGPATPNISKINDIFRKVIYVKASKYDMLMGTKNNLERYIEINKGFEKIRVQFDFNPMNIW